MSASIEFRCHQCGKLLRCGAAFAGKEAKCPQCGAMSIIPGQPANQGFANFDGQQAVPPAFAPTAQSTVEMGTPPGAGMHLGQGGQTPLPQYPQPPAPQFMGGQQGYGVAPTASYPAGGWQPPQMQPAPQAPGFAPMEAPLDAARLPKMSAEAGPAAAATPTRELFERIIAEIRKVYVGQDELVLGTLVALFSGGHVLIESFPGLGKTLFVRTLGQVLGCKFGRIQFTADLMPSDITGSPIFDMKEQEFRFRPGPVFTQLLLADEINRSPAKTHAALLEIMQEYRVTVDNTTHKLIRPFLVMATQNPIESEGTYNLPEAQLDRFMLKLLLDYPGEAEEAAILKMHSTQADLDKRLEGELQTVTSPEQIMTITRQNAQVRIDDKLVNYINRLVRKSRQWPQFHIGASPRAGLALMQAARTLAAFRGRDFAVPDDVVELALPALRHRVMLTAEAEVEGRQVDELLSEMVRTVEVPRL